METNEAQERSHVEKGEMSRGEQKSPKRPARIAGGYYQRQHGCIKDMERGHGIVSSNAGQQEKLSHNQRKNKGKHNGNRR